AGAPLFNTLLNYRHSAASQADDPASSAAWQGIEVIHAEERSNYPLTICAYLQQALVHLVQALKQPSENALIESSVLPEAEHEQLLTTFNDSHREYPREQPVHRLFERRAALHPQAIAA
ncbi:non-ribosomal peptide synthetase SyfB, partial [Pseudomonas syringae pv. actinidiae ICMP 19096]